MNEKKLHYQAEVIVGGNAWDSPAGSGKGADLKNPSGVAVDAVGNVFIADTENDRVLKLTTNGVVTVIADEIERPWSLVLSPSGDLWVRAWWELWRLSPTGERSRVLDWRPNGEGVQNDDGGSTDHVPGRTVWAIAVDADGTLYFTDDRHNQVCKLLPNGDVAVIAGSGRAGYADGPAEQAKFRSLRGLAVTPDGTIFVSDGNPRVRKITTEGQVVRFAGTYEGKRDGPADVAEFERPGALAVGPDGSVYVSGWAGGSTRRITPDGYVMTLMAAYERGRKTQEDEVASEAVAVGPDGTLYVASRFDQAIWKLTPKPPSRSRATGRRKLGDASRPSEPPQVLVTTLAGGWEPGQDDGSAESARFNGPTGILATPEGVYVADTSNHRVRRISVDGIVSTVAGTMRGDADGDVRNASFFEPMGLAWKASGDLVIADTWNDRIRCLARTGKVKTLAGQENWTSLVFHLNEGTTGVVRPDGDEIVQQMGESLDWIDYEDGKGTESKLNNPIGLVVDAEGNVLIADSRNGRIRRLAPDGTVTTLILHRSSRGLKYLWTGDKVPAGQLALPVGLAFGPNGDLFVSEAGLSRINRITADGQVHLVAGGNHGFIDGPAKSAAFNQPAGLAVDIEGNVYVADSGNHRVRRISKDGQVETVAGSDPGYVDGPGGTARFNEPWGLSFNPDGHLLVSDRKNNVVRKIHFQPVDVTLPAGLTPARSSDIIAIFSHAPGRVVRRKAAPETPRLTGWEQCVGRRVRIITKGSPDPFIRLYFEDAWIEVEGVGDDPMPYFKDALYDIDFHLDPSHLVGKTIVRLDVAYGEPGGNCEYVAFTFNDGLRQWLEPHYGTGLRIS